LAFDSTKVEIVNKLKEKKLLKTEEITAKLSDYIVGTNDGRLQLDTAYGFIMARGNKKDEKWSMYKQYCLVKHNYEGEIIKMAHINLEYLKDLGHFSFVYHKDGRPAGVVAVFSSFAIMGAKSQKDPKDNNHVMYYFDLDGNEKFHYTFEHGEADNPRGISPILLVEQEASLIMLNVNTEKLLKPKEELVFFDNKGKTETKSYEADLYPYQGSANNIRRLDDGSLLMTVVRSGAEGVAGMAVVSTDFKVIGKKFYRANSKTMPVIDYLGKFDNDYKFVITTQCQNHIVSIGQNKAAVTLPEEGDTGLCISKGLIGKNYVIDADAKKAYLFFQHNGGNGLGYVAIVGF
jgi:hypothetical protein